MARFRVLASGVVVAVPTNDYEFDDRETGRKVTGTTVSLAIVEDFGEEPMVVKVAKDLHEPVRALAAFCRVEADVSLWAQKSRGGGDAVIVGTARTVWVLDEKAKTRTNIATGESTPLPAAA